MKRVCAILLVAVSMIAATCIGAMAEQTPLVPAHPFPYEIMGENYVPSLYFPADSVRDERLVAVADFPTVTWEYCYCPSLYYEAWKIEAFLAKK